MRAGAFFLLLALCLIAWAKAQEAAPAAPAAPAETEKQVEAKKEEAPATTTTTTATTEADAPQAEEEGAEEKKKIKEGEALDSASSRTEQVRFQRLLLLFPAFVLLLLLKLSQK